MASQPENTKPTATPDNEPTVPRAHQPTTRVRQGEMMQQPQQRGVQMQNGQSQSQSQTRGGAPEQPAKELDGDGARQADDNAAEHSIDKQAGETETERAGESIEPTEDTSEPEPGSREAGVAQSGKEDLIDEGNPSASMSDSLDQYEVNMPQTMPPGSEDEQRKRQQAEMQERPRIEQDERGYGGASEEREEELDD